MAKSFINMPSKPQLYLMIPPPLYIDGVIDIYQNVINYWFPTIIKEIAFELELKKENIINIFELMGGENLEKWELMCDGLMCDGCHPNEAGYSYIAANIYKHIFLKNGPS